MANDRTNLQLSWLELSWLAVGVGAIVGVVGSCREVGSCRGLAVGVVGRCREVGSCRGWQLSRFEVGVVGIVGVVGSWKRCHGWQLAWLASDNVEKE